MIKFICNSCQSESILCDAYASFNIETQKWELFDVYDDMICNDCGGKDVEEIEHEPSATNSQESQK